MWRKICGKNCPILGFGSAKMSSFFLSKHRLHLLVLVSLGIPFKFGSDITVYSFVGIILLFYKPQPQTLNYFLIEFC